jgi:hypothetical protein
LGCDRHIYGEWIARLKFGWMETNVWWIGLTASAWWWCQWQKFLDSNPWPLVIVLAHSSSHHENVAHVINNACPPIPLPVELSLAVDSDTSLLETPCAAALICNDTPATVPAMPVVSMLVPQPLDQGRCHHLKQSSHLQWGRCLNWGSNWISSSCLLERESTAELPTRANQQPVSPPVCRPYPILIPVTQSILLCTMKMLSCHCTRVQWVMVGNVSHKCGHMWLHSPMVGTMVNTYSSPCALNYIFYQLFEADLLRWRWQLPNQGGHLFSLFINH